MQITLGRYLDGASWPDDAASLDPVIGHLSLGPIGFVSLLELRLGLGGPRPLPPLRIARYLSRLRSVSGERFFSASLVTDGWSTARRLLAWRDELIEAGWDGMALGLSTGRLADLAAVERVAEAQIPDGHAERFSAIVGRLPQDTHDLALDRVSLVEPRDSWPPAWRRIFELLESRSVAIVQSSPAAVSDAASDLARLQRIMADAHPACSACGDESLTLLSADTESDAAEAVAAWLAADRDANAGVVIVRGEGSQILDEALHRHGLPRLGVSRSSRWRAALQVLPLVLSNAWAPFNPYRMLELLTLPCTPVPRYAARELVEALREHPGVGGPRWIVAIETARASLESFLSSQEIDAATKASRLAEHDADVVRWVDRPRFDPVGGIAVEAAIAMCDDVKRWATRRAAGADGDLFHVVAGHANLLSQTIVATGLERLPRTQLERMLDAIINEGVAGDGRGPEAAPWSFVDEPGQIHGSARTVIWWGFHDQRVQAKRPWLTHDELDRLAEHGVELESPTSRRLTISRAWRMPLLHATDRVILVAPRLIAGTPAALHPMWDEIRASLARTDADEALLVKDASAMLRSAETCTLLGRSIVRRRVAVGSPPRPQREWIVRPGTIHRNETESPSSIEKLVNCPLSWTFRYPAGIRAGSLVALPEGNQMLGTLAHRIVQMLFEESHSWDPNRAGGRAVELFDDLTPGMAASLLEPGAEVERRGARDAVARSIPLLMRTIAEAGLTFVGSEQTSESSLPDGSPVKGRIDLLLRDAGGTPVILDLKWARWDKYLRQALVDGTSVQLAGYAHMHAADAATYPDAAYFMLLQGRLHAASDRTFPNAAVGAAQSLEDVWETVCERQRASFEMLASGRIITPWIADGDVNDEDIVAAAGGVPFKADAPCGFCEYTNLCRVNEVEP